MRKELIAMYGGDAALTPAKRLVLEDIIWESVVIRHGMSLILEEQSLKDPKKGLKQLVLDVTKVSDSRDRKLAMLGLDRHLKVINSLPRHVPTD